ncbi:sensor histidine kinase [Nocardioides mesophilus]|nr:sensor histidine kinase [Nocardioides mesophilus]
MTAPAPGPRQRPAAGPALLGVAVTAATVSVLLGLRVSDAHRALLELQWRWGDSVAGLALAAGGAVVLGRRPGHRLGWVLAGFGAWWALDGAAAAWLAFATTYTPALPGASVAFFVFQRLGAWLLLLLPLLLLLFPDGRLPTGRWRAVSVASLVMTALLPLALVAAPSDVAQVSSGAESMPAPLRALELDPVRVPLPDPVWSALLQVAYLCLPLSLVVPFAVVVRRYRGAGGTTRTQMRWLLWAAVVDLLVMLTIRLLPDSSGSLGLTVAVVVTSAAVAVGIVRPQLVDVDRLLGGTLVYGLLLASTWLLDLVLLGTAGRLLGPRLDDGEGLVLAVFVVSVLYAPLRHRLWRLVRRVVLGERDDPYRVVSGLAELLEESDDSEAQLTAVARTVARAFRVRYVGVEVVQVSGERLLVEHGERPDATQALPISYRGERIGRLLVPAVAGPRTGLSAADERLLADVVRQTAAAARAVHLAAELQHSRERLVTAVEDERRRLRRELHDGLGPTLAAVASRIDVARMTAPRSPEEADRSLALAREEITGTLAEVRRLVHGLRPPALDDVGLPGAVRQLAERLRRPGTEIRVAEPGDLGDLPAAVEVAAFRIVSEALANVVRHAGASYCTVRLGREAGALVVEVGDDGCGIDPEAPAGVGLVSLRERAAELGGRCAVTAGPDGGTLVRAELPLPDAGRAAAADAAPDAAKPAGAALAAEGRR